MHDQLLDFFIEELLERMRERVEADEERQLSIYEMTSFIEDRLERLAVKLVDLACDD